jgi:hypothetical protein
LAAVRNEGEKVKIRFFRPETEEEVSEPVRIKMQLGGTCNNARRKAL